MEVCPGAAEAAAPFGPLVGPGQHLTRALALGGADRGVVRVRAIGPLPCVIGRNGRQDRRHACHRLAKSHVVIPFVVRLERLHSPRDRVPLGDLSLRQRPVRVHRPVWLEVAAHPIEKLGAALFLRYFDGVMKAGDAHAPLGERIDLGQPVALQHRMPVAAVGEEEDGIRIVEGRRIGRPAAGVGRGQQLRPLCPCLEGGVEAFLGEHGARPMLVLARTMARLARHQHQLLSAVSQLQPLQVDVLELHLHRRTGVQLQGEDALGRPLAHLFVDRLRHQLVVDEVLKLRPLGHDQAAERLATPRGFGRAPAATFKKEQSSPSRTTHNLVFLRENDGSWGKATQNPTQSELRGRPQEVAPAQGL